jgi:hypothetical protein
VQWEINFAEWGSGYEAGQPWHVVNGSISADKHSVVFDMTGLGSDIDRYYYIRVKNTGDQPIAWEELTLSGTDHNTLARGMGVWSYKFTNAFAFLGLTGQRLDLAEAMGEGSAGEDKTALKPGEQVWYGVEIATDYFDKGANPLPPAAHNQKVSAVLTVVAGDSLAAPTAAAPTTAAPVAKSLPAPE